MRIKGFPPLVSRRLTTEDRRQYNHFYNSREGAGPQKDIWKVPAGATGWFPGMQEMFTGHGTGEVARGMMIRRVWKAGTLFRQLLFHRQGKHPE